MELIEVTLTMHLKASPERRMREFEATQMAFDVVSALEHIHKRGVIHRDVKPSNIMLTTAADGRTLYKLIDFSISAIALEHRSDNVSQTLQTGTTALTSM